MQDNYELVERARAVKMTKFVENPSITIQIQACNFRYKYEFVKCFNFIRIIKNLKQRLLNRANIILGGFGKKVLRHIFLIK